MKDEVEEEDFDENEIQCGTEVTDITVQIPLEYMYEYIRSVSWLAPAYNNKEIIKNGELNDLTYRQDLSRMFFQLVRETIIEEEGLADDYDEDE